MTPRWNHEPLFVSLAAAVPLFLSLFALNRLGPLDFWWWMGLNLTILLGLSLFLDRDLAGRIRGKDGPAPLVVFYGGILSALVLYGLFFLGGLMLRWMFPGADQGIAGVYAFRGQASSLRIALLMTLVIGPGEEFFWRGMVQHHLAGRYGSWIGVFTATLVYTLVHLPTANPVLLLAALVCGLYWGLLYHFTRSLPLVALSHTAWDLLVFLALPLAS